MTKNWAEFRAKETGWGEWIEGLSENRVNGNCAWQCEGQGRGWSWRWLRLILNHCVMEVELIPGNQQRHFPHSSVDKETVCNAGDPSSIPGSGRYTGEGIGYPLPYSWAHCLMEVELIPENHQWHFPHSSAGKKSSCNAGDLGLVPGSGRSPGEGKGYPLQYSGLEIV